MNVLMFNQGHFPTYEDAKSSGAVYETEFTIGAMNNVDGIKDTVELINCAQRCLGDDPFMVGVMVDGDFMSLDNYVNHKWIETRQAVYVTHDELGVIDTVHANEEDCIEQTEISDEEETLWDTLYIGEDEHPEDMLGENIGGYKDHHVNN